MASYNPPKTFDDLYNEMYESYMMDDHASMTAVDNILNRIINEEASSSHITRTKKKRENTERKREEGHKQIWNKQPNSQCTTTPPKVSDEKKIIPSHRPRS
ncbi:hypothetical protein BVRB_007500 [Beta vulgaris subsp. vulgaris]|uniref:Uncharacterized protein n=1 Tax=Beta vulgaris subsp. vulgaris TaxID=3555 RepID=A0A0J8B332_BETVV|nr:hypothetical protein BVRB_007500 [Beta vulgaris subsp. vulgaris]